MRISDWSSDVCASDLVEQTAEIGDRPGCHALTQLINRFFERFEIFIECTTRHACGLDHVIDHQMSPAPAGLIEVQHRIQQPGAHRSEEHTSELQSLMRISYAVFCLKKKTEIHRIEH